MKKIAALLAGVLMMAAASAWATPILKLTDGTNTETIVGTGDRVTYVGQIGDWSFNVSTGVFGNAAGLGIPQMDLNSINSSAEGKIPGTLTITLSDVIIGPWTGPGADIMVGGNSNIGGSVSFQTLINSVPVSYLAFNGQTKFNFSGNDTFNYAPTGQDTIDIVTTITHLGQGTTSFDYAVTPVPEPGTMMLLGAGFLGLAIYGKRRKNA